MPTKLSISTHRSTDYQQATDGLSIFLRMVLTTHSSSRSSHGVTAHEQGWLPQMTSHPVGYCAGKQKRHRTHTFHTHNATRLNPNSNSHGSITRRREIIPAIDPPRCFAPGPAGVETKTSARSDLSGGLRSRMVPRFGITLMTIVSASHLCRRGQRHSQARLRRLGGLGASRDSSAWRARRTAWPRVVADARTGEAGEA
jgi:hypothetical protein